MRLEPAADIKLWRMQMTIVDETQRKLTESLNAEGRSASHVALGVVLCLAMIGATTALSAAQPQPAAPGGEPSRKPLIRAIWPALFSMTTLAALRVWNAPSSQERTRALGLWGLLQAVNLGFMLWKPDAPKARLAAAVATAGLTAAYARSAAYVDEEAAGMVAPTGFAGLASIVANPT